MRYQTGLGAGQHKIRNSRGRENTSLGTSRFNFSKHATKHFDRWNGVLLLVRKDCANVKFTTCFDKTHPFTENTLSLPVQIEILTLAKVLAYE